MQRLTSFIGKSNLKSNNILGVFPSQFTLRRQYRTSMEQPNREEIIKNLGEVKFRIEKLAQELELPYVPRLVAVSKTKDPPVIKACYDGGQRHFGENYAQEMLDKCKELPDDICWHFIGHLQSNKVKPLLQEVKSLYIVETVDSTKLADNLNKHAPSAPKAFSPNNPLNVYVQVNTSGEESKSGIEPSKCVELAQHIISNCKNLKLCGLMTIGKFEVSEDNEDFKCLARCREEVANKLGLKKEELDLSMGMSHDFETAIRLGSTNVRVGSTIFGARDHAKMMAHEKGSK